jgi:hypothetical protein
MIRSKAILLGLFVMGTLWTPLAFGQTGYYPPRGPISPWMNIFQRKPGPLDNYHSYVQPDLRMQAEFNRQNNALLRNAQGLQFLGQQMETAQRETQVRPTGTGSVFMEYSHYYPTKGVRTPLSARGQFRGMAPSTGTWYAR